MTGSSNWREHLYSGGGAPGNEVKAALLDTDLRIANMPDTGDLAPVKKRLGDWLDRIAGGLTDERTAGDKETLTSLSDLRVHVLQVERGFRTAPGKYSIMYIASLLLWGGALWAAWAGASGSVSFDDDWLGITVRAWVAVFAIGVAGSVTMVLSRIYQGTFQLTDIRFTVGTERLYGDMSRPEGYACDSDLPFGQRASTWFESFLTNDMVRVAFRALVRPILGGVVALAVFLILISGLVLEPLVTPMLPVTGPIDFIDARSAGFFLSIAFVAGFSDQLAWSMLNSLMNKLSGAVGEPSAAPADSGIPEAVIGLLNPGASR